LRLEEEDLSTSSNDSDDSGLGAGCEASDDLVAYGVDGVFDEACCTCAYIDSIDDSVTGSDGDKLLPSLSTMG